MVEVNLLALHVIYHQLGIYPVRVGDETHSLAIISVLNECGNKVLKRDEYAFLMQFLTKYDSKAEKFDFSKVGEITKKDPAIVQELFNSICGKLGDSGFKKPLINSGLITTKCFKKLNFMGVENKVFKLSMLT